MSEVQEVEYVGAAQAEAWAEQTAANLLDAWRLVGERIRHEAAEGHLGVEAAARILGALDTLATAEAQRITAADLQHKVAMKQVEELGEYARSGGGYTHN